MFTPRQYENSFLVLLRWTTRIFSAFCMGLLLFFIASIGANFLYIDWKDLVVLLLFLLAFFGGLAWAWKDELKGGALAVLGVAGFYFVYGLPLEPSLRLAVWTLMFSLPGFLFLLYGVISTLSQRYARAGVAMRLRAFGTQTRSAGGSMAGPMTASRH
jgi:hypothetical protein